MLGEGPVEIPSDEKDIFDTCQAIFDETDGDNASKILFGVLAKHNITKMNKEAKIKKMAQDSRQRNNWSRGQRNKWNRSVDGFNEATPWRVGRDKYYDFTHYATDEIKLDEDPQHIYSGESLWRTYIMDKFYRDYKDANGKVVGGYINDRFHVFPTAGTPANPDVPRDGGNQMELADGERTRQPRPQEYSTERRLEEARGNKTKSITVAKSFNRIIKMASKTTEDVENDKIYNIFRDTIEMREAKIDYELMISSIADHYNASILGVAQIDRSAQKLISKHNGIAYETTMRKAAILADMLENNGQNNLLVSDPNGADAVLGGNHSRIHLDAGTVFVNVPDMTNVFQIVEHPTDASLVGNRVSFADMNFEVSAQPFIQEAADELGLNEADVSLVEEAVQKEQAANTTGYAEFPVTELQP